jgi:hypothetical protein
MLRGVQAIFVVCRRCDILKPEPVAPHQQADLAKRSLAFISLDFRNR